MYSKILVPLDGSATAETVFPYVEALASGFKTQVELLSVIDIGAMATHLTADKTHHLDSLIANEEKKISNYLEKVAKRLAGLSTECRLVRGHPAETILDSTSQDCDMLIAMATHGRSGAERWLLGSVAEKVLRGSNHPLFLVRAAVAQTTPRRIIDGLVVPLDGSALAEKILPTVTSWAKALDLEVTLVRAFEFPAADYYHSEKALPDYDAFRAQAHKEAVDYLKRIEHQLVGAGVRTVSISALEGAAADEIIHFAQRDPRGVIAMSTHGRSGVRRWLLGSVTEKIVRHGNDPVLVIRGE